MKLQEKAIEAAKRFLYHRGWEILETDYRSDDEGIDIVGMDGDCLVFVDVQAVRGSKDFPKEHYDKKTRERFEKLAIKFASTHDIVDKAMRFDVVSLLVIANDRALIRHHVNALLAA